MPPHGVQSRKPPSGWTVAELEVMRDCLRDEAWLMAVAPSYPVLLWGRMVVGVGVGIASSTVPQYIAELAPPARRGTLVSTNTVAIVGIQDSGIESDHRDLNGGGLPFSGGGWDCTPTGDPWSAASPSGREPGFRRSSSLRRAVSMLSAQS